MNKSQQRQFGMSWKKFVSIKIYFTYGIAKNV